MLSNYTSYLSGGSDLLQGASSFAMTYDALGNKRTEAATIPAEGGTPLANTSHGITYSYDDGNPTTYKNASFAYDAKDRLTAISSPAFSAAYDGDGLRARKTAAGVTTYYVYDGSTPIAQENFNGALASFTALNVITADGWRARKQGNLVYPFICNLQSAAPPLFHERPTAHC